ncbi:MAG TPA: COX15/CtaA family protein [Acidimicrobiia bacterium]
MRRLPRLTPSAYRKVTFVAAVLLAIIIVTGGAVRLSDSGLGCPQWPNCAEGSLAPKEASDANAMIEFVNRVFTGLVSVAVIVAVLGSLLRRPRRRDLVWLSFGLVAGVAAQAVLGGLTVLFHLAPQFVMAHFLVSLVLLTNALVLHRRAGLPDAPSRPLVAPVLVGLGRALLAVAAAVVVTGTVLTGSGPHSGGAPEDEVERFNLVIPEVARVHGATVMAFLVLVLVTLAVLRRVRAPRNVQERLGVLLVAVVAQAGVGYAQYFNDIPALLVGIHIAGATVVWAAVVAFYLGLFAPAAATPGVALRREVAAAGVH